MPSLIDLYERPRDGLHTLYVSPLKALATDIARNLTAQANIIRNGAQSGDTTQNCLDRLQADCLAFSPQVVIMQMPGINDTSAGNGNIAEDTIASNQQSIINQILAAGARIGVLCGPGNNGGDGFVAARLLCERGYDVRAWCSVERSALQGSAAVMAGRWAGYVTDDQMLIFGHSEWAGPDLVIDALFGAGLSRPLEGDAASTIVMTSDARLRVLAVDIPSGVHGDTGAKLGDYAFQAERTVTFFRRRPGHLLLPGREMCGKIVVADIGIPHDIFDDHYFGDEHAILCPRVLANDPANWLDQFPRLDRNAHKYMRGHAVVVSGPPDQTGAARLGARGALRAGAGLVTVASPLLAFPVNAAHLTAIMLKPFEVPAGLAGILGDKRKNAVLIGPGCSVGRATREMVEIVLSSDAAAVLDADALISFVEPGAPLDGGPSFGYLKTRAAPSAIGPEVLFTAIKARGVRPVVLTPHEGEFKRLFGALPGSKLDRARAAAKTSGAVVVLKGPDTVIASPDGRAVINDNAPPWLATAGSGDVLAGFITGLLAQGMPAFQAACAAVWLHGECANVFGAGLIAEDLPEVLPRVLANLPRRGVRLGRSALIEALRAGG